MIAGNDISVIAPLTRPTNGSPTTNIYLHADVTHKHEAVDRVTPLDVEPGRYQPSDPPIAFLEALRLCTQFPALTTGEQDVLGNFGNASVGTIVVEPIWS